MIDKFGVSVQGILISLFLSIVHLIFEGIFLLMESQVTKTSLLNYSIVCFNGRFGWVPYEDYLTDASKKEDNQ